MNRLFAAVALLFVGACLGVGTTVGWYLYGHRTTTVYTTTAELRSGGVVVPEGTELIHQGAMSEGFDRLALYLNVQSTTLEQRLTRRVEAEAFLEIPYWVEATEAER